MAGHEVVAGFQWIYSMLSGDSAFATNAPGGIWRSLAPPDATPVWVIMGYQSGSDVTTMNAFRLMDSLLYQVKAVGPPAQMTAIAATALWIDQVLCPNEKSGSGTVAGGYIGSCYREQPLFVDEPPINGEQWSNCGGLYRLQIKQM